MPSPWYCATLQNMPASRHLRIAVESFWHELCGKPSRAVNSCSCLRVSITVRMARVLIKCSRHHALSPRMAWILSFANQFFIGSFFSIQKRLNLEAAVHFEQRGVVAIGRRKLALGGIHGLLLAARHVKDGLNREHGNDSATSNNTKVSTPSTKKRPANIHIKNTIKGRLQTSESRRDKRTARPSKSLWLGRDQAGIAPFADPPASARWRR